MKTVFSIIVFLIISWSVSGQNVIYDAMTSPNLSNVTNDETTAMMLALAGSGKTTITDQGNGKYFMKITIGKGQSITDYLASPKVVNSKLIQFGLASEPQVKISITPEIVDIGGKLELIVLSKDAFTNLLKVLNGRIGSSSSTGNKTKAPQSRPASLPSSGELSPKVFALHPFGFLSSNVTSHQSALQQLRNAGWKADYNDYGTSTQIMIISSSQFKIPFTLFGKDLTILSSYGTPQGNMLSYGLEVTDYKTNWTEDETRLFAEKIVEELLSQGYVEDTDDDMLYGYQFYRRKLTGNGVSYITVEATQASRHESFDSFGVRVNVWRE
ncbi:MAG: hypothetical protein J1E99_08495 [Muribaculaceae bacterium]|nr:hypothetical protein [Muribaculaceae bacterium]